VNRGYIVRVVVNTAESFAQIAAELGSIWWRSQGAWEAPVIVLISCGGYRPGLGPFHSQTLESLAAHVPDSRKAMIAGTSHWMFEQAPQRFCEIVLEFLAA